MGTDPVGEEILLVAVPEEGQLEFLLLKQKHAVTLPIPCRRNVGSQLKPRLAGPCELARL
jgi:hypothetical protein